MSLIQIALVLGSILLLWLYSAFLRSTLRDRVLAILLFVTAVVAILVPDLTTRVANVLGVGGEPTCSFTCSFWGQSLPSLS